MNTRIISITLIFTFLVIGGMVYLSTLEGSTEHPIEELEKLATCLTDNGAKFYGAYWCGHCQSQKRMFGTAVDLLPYIECSTDDPQVQNPICEEAMITSYPTWEFADGGLLLGEVPLAQLANRAECTFMGVEPTIEEDEDEVPTQTDATEMEEEVAPADEIELDVTASDEV